MGQPGWPASVVVAGRLDRPTSRLVDDLSAALDRRSGGEAVLVVDDLEAAATAASRTLNAVVCTTRGHCGRRGLERLVTPVVFGGPDSPTPDSGRPGGAVTVCLDGSPEAESVLPFAAAWAAVVRSRITLVHVVIPGPRAVGSGSPDNNDLLPAGYLASVSARLSGSGIAVDWEVLHGPPYEAIVDFVSHNGGSLIALASTIDGAGTFVRPGSLAGRLARCGPVPVLVSPLPARARPTARRRRRCARPPGRTRSVGAPATIRVDAHALNGAALAYRSRTQAPAARRQTETPRASSRMAVGLLAAGLALVVSFFALVPAPYDAIIGTTTRADEMVSTAVGEADPDRGRILVTLVHRRSITAFDALRGWLDSHVDVYPNQGRAATDPTAEGALIERSVTAANTVVAAHLDLDPTATYAAVDTGSLGGPSAGLAFALAILDVLSPGDVTGGRVVAATGALTSDGVVHAVGGVRYKAWAAWRAGADVFLVPAANYDEAVDAAPRLEIVAVTTFDDALAALAGH